MQEDSWIAGSEESTAVDTLATMWSTGCWGDDADATSQLHLPGKRGKKTALTSRPNCPFQAGSVVVASFGEIDPQLSWRTGSSSSYVSVLPITVLCDVATASPLFAPSTRPSTLVGRWAM